MRSEKKNIIKLPGGIQLKEKIADTLANWLKFYFQLEVTTSESSKKMQAYDISIFINFIIREYGNDDRKFWTPRASRSFQEYLKTVINEKSHKRRWRDRSINRVIAHLKTFSKWINKLSPFPLGNPMDKIKMIRTTTGLEIERALTPQERNRMLDGADFILKTGGISKDRNRYKKKERPRRKGFRPYRNRAIIYTLIETGMRRAGIVNLKLDDVNFNKNEITVLEKGGQLHTYLISKEGLDAIKDYLENERNKDNEKWQSEYLFISSSTNNKETGKITTRMVNFIWDEMCEVAGIEGKTPHSARHAMGKYIIEKTGNIAAVQRQLGHKNAAYSMQYARITADELHEVLDDR